MVPVLEIRHLWKSYPGFTLRDVSLTLKRGTVTALLGRNGAGKTTLIKCALGVIPRDRGSIRFQGVEREYGEVAWRRSVGYVAESHPLYDWMRVEQFLRFIAAHYPTWDDAYCQRLLERFRLDPHKQIRELSHGMRVGLALIAALAYRPILLLLDEPMAGLDPIARADFLQWLREDAIAPEAGRAVLISSHILEDVVAVADEIVIIRHGEVVTHASLGDLEREWRILSVASWTSAQQWSAFPVIRGRDGSVRLLCRRQESEGLVAELTARGIAVLDVRAPTLHELFLGLA